MSVKDVKIILKILFKKVGLSQCVGKSQISFAYDSFMSG